MFKISQAHNKILKQILILILILVGAAVCLSIVYVSSSYFTKEGHFETQPIAFSHELHTNSVGLDCKFCHSEVDRSASAGMPSMETCYGCHREVLNKSKFLEPVRKAYEENKTIPWNRVNRLPDHVYFHHAEHIKAGVACISCHGDVHEMPLIKKELHFTMERCLDCHKKNKDSHLKGCYTCHR